MKIIVTLILFILLIIIDSENEDGDNDCNDDYTFNTTLHLQRF
jgi:hypothetical protein